MAYFLAKTDPETYSIDQLEKEKKTTWDGVNNPQAVRAIRDMRPGDKVFIYHSGGDSAVVGLAKVVSEGRPDPKNPKSAVADFEFIRRIEPASDVGRDQAVEAFRRLGAGPPGPSVNHARAAGVRGVDAEEEPEVEN